MLSPTTLSMGLVHNTVNQHLHKINECMIDFCTCTLEYRIACSGCSGRSGIQGFPYTHTDVLLDNTWCVFYHHRMCLAIDFLYVSSLN